MPGSGELTNFGLSIRVSEALEDAEWDRFVVDTPGGHHVQTSLWALVKASQGWRSVRILATENGHMVAGSQILIHSYPLVGSIGYVTKGPLCRNGNPELIKYLIKQIRCVSQDHHCQLVTIQPPNNGQYMSSLLAEQGFRRSTLKLAPVASILIDLSPNIDQIFARLKPKTRQYINRSKREGITIHEGTVDDFDIFYSLHLETSKRQKFMPYPKSYYKTMRRVLGPHGHFQILIAKYEGRAVSGLLIVPFKDTVIAKIIGWSGLHRERRPNVALYWGSIQWAKEHGYRYLDLEGVDPEGARNALQGKPVTKLISHSPDKLKYGFGGKIVLYPEAYDIVYKPVYRWLYYGLQRRIARQSSISKAVDYFRKR